MASKKEIIEERKANLPLPDQPPTASDWNSADDRNVDVGSGGQVDDIPAGSAMREPASAESAVRVDGEEWKTNVAGSNVGREAKDDLDGLPNDAVTRDTKNKPGLTDTTGADYGYPQKSDPSSGIKQ